jgi:regulator of replication initiation timing
MPCQVTDRVTAETFVRGEAGRLKTANEELEKVVKALADENTELVKQNEHLQAALDSYQRLFQQPFQVRSRNVQVDNFDQDG